MKTRIGLFLFLLACNPPASRNPILTTEQSAIAGAYSAELQLCIQRARAGKGTLAEYEACAKEVDSRYGVK